MELKKKILNLLYPEITCVLCGSERVQEKRYCMCTDCYERLPALMETVGEFPFCPVFSAFRYAGGMKKLLHQFKYDNCRYLAPYVGAFLYDGLQKSGFTADVLTPVPLYPAKERRRGYNQSRLLCEELSRYSGLPAENCLIRVRNTPSQTNLKEAERRENVRGAFRAKAMNGRRVLLIDDVITTGSTAGECVQALYAQGAEAVYMMTVACSISAK